jgi:two-component system heavy metal sensor histidine kinase CusS
VRVSFRLRLAIISALLGALALGGFAAIALWQMREAAIDDLDREFLAQAERELSRRWPAGHWPPHEGNMARAFGTDHPGQSLLLVMVDGRVAYRSRHWPEELDPQGLPWPILPSPPSRSRGPALGSLTLNLGGRPWRFGLAATPQGYMAMGVDLAVVYAGMGRLRNAFLLAAPLSLGLIGFGAWLLSSRALSPVRRLTAAMERVTAKGLDQRMAFGREDRELHQLIRVINRMLERLERSFRQASRFSADAAHELKTPLAILQGQVEQSIAQCEPGSEVQGQLSGILDEVQRLATITRKLLLLSRADAGGLRLHRVPFDLSRVLRELLDDAKMLAPQLEVRGVVAPGLTVTADAELLTQLLHNLLNNAIKHNLATGWIRIGAKRQGGCIEVTVANSAQEIPAEERARIFERFYRTDSARSRHTEGAGLGLSLAREIALAHGGQLRLAEPAAGEVRFVLTLPGQMTKL